MLLPLTLFPQPLLSQDRLQQFNRAVLLTTCRSFFFPPWVYSIVFVSLSMVLAVTVHRSLPHQDSGWVPSPCLCVSKCPREHSADVRRRCTGQTITGHDDTWRLPFAQGRYVVRLAACKCHPRSSSSSSLRTTTVLANIALSPSRQ